MMQLILSSTVIPWKWTEPWRGFVPAGFQVCMWMGDMVHRDRVETTGERNRLAPPFVARLARGSPFMAASPGSTVP